LFFTDVVDHDPAAVEKHLRAPGMDGHLDAVEAALAVLETYDAASTEAALRTTAEARGVKPAALIHAVRVAVSGKTVTPGLFDVLELLGRARVRSRIAEARRLLSASRS
jgi:glutamyl-tRNA synthetase